MRIAYLGLDEVNRYFARKWARRIDAGIQYVDVRNLSVSSGCPVLVVDLDSLPPTHRQRWMGWLTSFACDTPVLAFGHSVREDESDALMSCGKRVIRRGLCRNTLQRWIERELLCAA